MSILPQIFEKNINRNLLFPVERPKNPFYTFLTRCNFFYCSYFFYFSTKWTIKFNKNNKRRNLEPFLNHKVSFKNFIKTVFQFFFSFNLK